MALSAPEDLYAMVRFAKVTVCMNCSFGHDYISCKYGHNDGSWWGWLSWIKSFSRALENRVWFDFSVNFYNINAFVNGICLNICCNVIYLSTYQRPLRDQKVEDNKYQNLIHLNISDNTKLRLNCSLEKRLPVFIEFCFATNSDPPPRKGAPESIVENFLLLPVVSWGLQNIFQGPKHFSNLRKILSYYQEVQNLTCVEYFF